MYKFLGMGEGGGGGAGKFDHEAQAQILDMLQTWQSDVSLSQREIKTKKERGKNDSDSGRDSNPRPGKWPAML